MLHCSEHGALKIGNSLREMQTTNRKIFKIKHDVGYSALKLLV